MRILALSPAAAILVLTACGAPKEALTPISEGARAAPPPLLVETKRFDAALAAAGPDSTRLGSDADALAARATALQARASGLAGPVVEPAERSRLEAAVAGG